MKKRLAVLICCLIICGQLVITQAFVSGEYTMGFTGSSNNPITTLSDPNPTTE